MMRRAVAVTAVSVLLLSASLVGRAGGLEQERVDAVAAFHALAAQAQDAAQRTDHLAASIDQAQRAAAQRAEVLAARPAFVAELAELRSALDGARGKVDTAAHRAAAFAVQQTVLDETDDVDTVAAASATIDAITTKVGAEVASWQAVQAARSVGPGGPVWSTSGPDGYARVRAALDRVGGAGIGLYESGSCGGGTAPACANSNGYIKYRGDLATWSESRLNWAMAHELAHIHQFRVWGSMNASPEYNSLFGGDPEFLANCMAVVRGYPGAVDCDGEQRIWASGIWVGTVH